MTRRIPRLASAALVGLLLASAAAPADGATDLLAQARAAAQKKQYAEADKLYTDALAAAGTKNAKLTGEILLGRVGSLREWRAAEPDNAAVPQKLENAYRAVIGERTVPGEERVKATNNLGVLLIAEKKPEEAATVLRKILPAEGAHPDAHIFLANYAQALEDANKPKDALHAYQQSLAQEPRFRRAAEGAVHTLKLLNADPNWPEDLQSFFKVNGLPVTTVGDAAYELLALGGAAEGKVLPYLARYYATFPVSAARFAEVEKRRLLALVKPGAKQPDWMTDLIGAYEKVGFAPVPQAADLEMNGARGLPNWQKTLPGCKEVLGHEAVRRDFARLLTQAGDGFRTPAAKDGERVPDPKEALARYLVAQSLDPAFPDAPLAAVRTLTEFRDKLDPNYALLNAYAGVLLHQKDGLKEKLKEKGEAVTRDDYVTLSTLHMVLAHIFEGQKFWSKIENPEPNVNEKRRNAVFQWEEAIRDEESIRELDRDYPPSPTLRERLANACLRSSLSDGKATAGRSYLEAADLALNAGRRDRARFYINEAVGLVSTEAEKAALAELARLADASGPVWEKVTDRSPSLPHLDGETVFFAEGTVLAVWSRPENKKLAEAALPGRPAAWAGKGTQFAAAAAKKEDGTVADQVAVYSFRGSELSKVNLGEHPGGVKALAITPDGKVVASLGAKADVMLWVDGKHVKTLSPAVGEPHLLELAPDGGTIVVAGTTKDGNRLAVIDGPTGRAQLQGDLPQAKITALAVSPSKGEPVIAVGTSDGELRVYRLGGGLVWKFQAHPGPVYDRRPRPVHVLGVAFHPEGTWVATLGGDRSVRVWDYHRAEPRELARFGHPFQPKAVAVAPDGKLLAVTSPYPTGGEVRVWPAPGGGK